MVAARLHQEVHHTVGFHTGGLGGLAGGLLVEEGGGVGVAQRVFIGKAHLVHLLLHFAHLGHVHILGRGHDVERLHIEGGALAVGALMARQADVYLLVLAKGGLGVAVVAVVRGPYHHVAFTGREEGAALGVGVFGGHGAVFGVVVDFEVYACTLHGLTVSVGDEKVGASRGGIVVDEVDLGEVGGAQHHFFRTVVVAEGAGVHEHGARRGGVEPSQVKHSLGLAGAQKVPFAVGPGFHPGVVVVGVGPARRIDLPGGNARRPQRRHGQHRFLTAASHAAPDGL